MDKHLRNTGSAAAGAVVLFFILLFVYTKLVGPIPFTVNNINTSKDTPFQVEGQGSASAAPDQATISFGVTKNSPAVSDAQSQTNNAIDSILNNLKKIGISDKDTKTTNYSVNPNYSFEGTQRITGYNVTQNIEVKIKDIKNTNRAVDTIIESGANLVGQIQFGFTDKSKVELEEKARKEAVDKAKQKAQSIAKIAGVRLGKIINVQELQQGGISPIPFLGREAESQPSKETNITPGENSVKLTIILTYEIN